MEKTYYKQIKWQEPNSGEGILISLIVTLNQRAAEDTKRVVHTVTCYTTNPSTKATQVFTEEQIGEDFSVAIDLVLQDIYEQVSSFYTKSTPSTRYEEWLINDGFNTSQGLSVEIPRRAKRAEE